MVQPPQRVVDPSFFLDSPISFEKSPSVVFGQNYSPSSPSGSVLLGEISAFDASLVCNTPEVVGGLYSQPLGYCSSKYSLLVEENELDSPIFCESESPSLEQIKIKRGELLSPCPLSFDKDNLEVEGVEFLGLDPWGKKLIEKCLIQSPKTMIGGEFCSLLDPFPYFLSEDEICSFPQYIVEDLHASPNSLVREISDEAGCSLGEDSGRWAAV